MEGEADESLYVVRASAVRASIAALVEPRIHPWFPAYLHLRQQSSSQNTLTEIAPNWGALGDLLKLPGGPYRRPHFRPFWNRKSEAGQFWLGDNLAGSYSPSSVRAVPRKVIDITPQGRYVLRDKHWELAREHFTNGQRVPVLALASFLLRDFGVVSPTVPDRDDLMRLFLGEFGYDRPGDRTEVDYLYDRDWSGPKGAWFEEFAGEESG